MTDHSVDPFKTCQKLPAGSIVILRDYDMPEAEREAFARKLLKACKRRGLLLLIGKTPALALKIRCAGIHLPEFLANQAPAYIRRNPHHIVTIAAHSRRAACRAAKLGADAVLISPVLATRSHPDQKPLGLYRAAHMVLPYICSYALGGVGPHYLKKLKLFGFQGVASISGYK